MDWPGEFAFQPDVFEPTEKRCEGADHFLTGQARADTEVWTRTKGKVRACIWPVDVELVRAFESGRIPVRCSIARQHH